MVRDRRTFSGKIYKNSRPEKEIKKISNLPEEQKETATQRLLFDRATMDETAPTGKIQLIWSYILDYENDKNPFKERKMQIRGLKKYVIIDIQENNELPGTANSLNQKGIKKFDSLHIAWFPCSGVGPRKQEP